MGLFSSAWPRLHWELCCQPWTGPWGPDGLNFTIRRKYRHKGCATESHYRSAATPKQWQGRKQKQNQKCELLDLIKQQYSTYWRPWGGRQQDQQPKYSRWAQIQSGTWQPNVWHISDRNLDAGLGMGAMCIILGLMYAVDFIVSFVQRKRILRDEKA